MQRHVAAEGETTSDLDLSCREAGPGARQPWCGGHRLQLWWPRRHLTTPFRRRPRRCRQMLGMTHGFALDVHCGLHGVRLRPCRLPTTSFAWARPTGCFSSAPRPSRAFWTGTTAAPACWFGDGAGAVILEAATGDCGVLSTHLHSDGRYRDMLHVDGGPSTTRHVGHLKMNGA